MVTNTKLLAEALERADCRTCDEVEATVDGEVRNQNWESAHVQFEQHMKEEDEGKGNVAERTT